MEERVKEQIEDVENDDNYDVAIECAICLNTFEKNVNISTTKCGHRFHCSCLIKAALKKRQCPMCRKNLLEEEDDENVQDARILDNRVYIFNGQFPLIVEQLRQIFDNALEDGNEEHKEDEDDDEYSDNNSIFDDLPTLEPYDNDEFYFNSDTDTDTDFNIEVQNDNGDESVD